MARIAAASFIAVQALVPAVQLGQERVSRWGWQMFAAPTPPVPVRIDYPDRAVFTSLARLLPYPRPEIRPSLALHHRVCHELPGAVRLRIGSITGPCER